MAGKDFDTGGVFRDPQGKIYIKNVIDIGSVITTKSVASISSVNIDTLTTGSSFNVGTGPSGAGKSGDGYYLSKMLISESPVSSRQLKFNPKGSGTSTTRSATVSIPDPRTEFVVAFTAGAFSGQGHITSGRGFSLDETVQAYVNGTTWLGRVSYADNVTGSYNEDYGITGAVVGFYNCGPTYATGGATGPCGGHSGDTGPGISGLSSGAFGYPFTVYTVMSPDNIRSQLLFGGNNTAGFSSAQELNDPSMVEFTYGTGPAGATLPKGYIKNTLSDKAQVVRTNHELYGAGQASEFISSMKVHLVTGATLVLSTTAGSSGGGSGGASGPGIFQEFATTALETVNNNTDAFFEIRNELNQLDSVHKLLYAGLTN